MLAEAPEMVQQVPGDQLVPYSRDWVATGQHFGHWPIPFFSWASLWPPQLPPARVQVLYLQSSKDQLVGDRAVAGWASVGLENRLKAGC